MFLLGRFLNGLCSQAVGQSPPWPVSSALCVRTGDRFAPYGMIATRFPVSNDSIAVRANTNARRPAAAWIGGGSPA